MATIESGTGANTKKKAAAFINVTVVSSDGESKKNLGGIPLYADNAFHAALLEHIKDGAEVSLETGIHIISDEVSFEF